MDSSRIESVGAGEFAASRRLAICIVTETFPPEVNGVSMSVARLSAGLAGRGHAVQIVTPRRRDRTVDQVDAAVQVLSVPGLPIPRYRNLRLGLPLVGAVRALWRARPPDVVYIATQGPLGWSVLREAIRRSIPVVSGFHTNFHVYCRHYGLRTLERLVLSYLRRFHRRTRCTLVPTRELADALHAMDMGRIAVLGRGVDTALYTPARRDDSLRARWGLGPEGTAVIHVGRLAAEKNLQLAIRSFRALEAGPGEYRFVLVGDGPLAAELARENPDFIFCGTQTAEALAAHYASGDIFLFPSLSETFGNVLLEAMASGLSVVAFDRAGAKEHIRSYTNGIAVQADSESAFLHAALCLAGDRALVRDTGQRARRHSLAFGWDQVVGDFERILMTHASPTGAATDITPRP